MAKSTLPIIRRFRWDGFKTLDADDIVSFEVSEPDENKRIHALNVKPVLTTCHGASEAEKEKIACYGR